MSLRQKSTKHLAILCAFAKDHEEIKKNLTYGVSLIKSNHWEAYRAIRAKDRQKARKAMLTVLKQTEKDLLKRETK